jgi:hypothetical protein
MAMFHILAHAFLRLGQAPIIALLMLVVWACQRAVRAPRVQAPEALDPTEDERYAAARGPEPEEN